MTRSELERRVSSSRDAQHTCTEVVGHVADTACVMSVRLPPDSVDVKLNVEYVPAAAGREPVVRELTVERPLPLDVDGVRLAKGLADAFERQTTLLDSRDATYGPHRATS